MEEMINFIVENKDKLTKQEIASKLNELVNICLENKSSKKLVYDSVVILKVGDVLLKKEMGKLTGRYSIDAVKGFFAYSKNIKFSKFQQSKTNIRAWFTSKYTPILYELC